MSVAWQATLFGDAPPAPGRGEPTRLPLAGGAWVDHAPGWLAGADRLMADLLDAAPWAQRRRRMYEGMVDEPRLTAWWELGPDAGPPPLPVLAELGRVLSARYGVAFDSVGCNLYRDGHDSVAWHGDTVRKVLAEPVVAIVSLGEPRPLLLRPTGGGRSLRFGLGQGDLFVMGGTCQHTWQHSVPKVRRAGPRISVTYRHRA
jgi:alkylated DNA repair dioxygenase AlkB